MTYYAASGLKSPFPMLPFHLSDLISIDTVNQLATGQAVFSMHQLPKWFFITEQHNWDISQILLSNPYPISPQFNVVT